ncbi:MAG TPA: cation diffusion facilitator family transporter [Spirochaetia bacterium]|nr:cation diffusion facilitator family transporter [Spirochaetia bacterium]
MTNGTRLRLSHRVINLGLGANIFLSLVKTVVGIMGSSQALLADGINSTSDVIYYIVVKVFLRLAHKPPDTEHPYGHGQLESIAALVVGSFVITTAAAIFWNSISNVFELLTGEVQSPGAALIALWIALFTVCLKIFLTLWTRKVGRKSGNAAVDALASDHRNDIFASSAVAVGIFLARIGLRWLDPLAGALVSLIILYTGISILRDAAADLMETLPGHTLKKQIESLLSAMPEIRQIMEIHAHRFGPTFVINLTVGLDGSLSIKDGDRIALRIMDMVHNELDFVSKVYVYYRPALKVDSVS